MPRTLPEISRVQTIRKLPSNLKNPIPGMNANLQAYGENFRFYLGGIHPCILTAEPGFIQHVLQKANRKYVKSPLHFRQLARYMGMGLLTIDGDHWLRQRRLIQPGFHRDRIQGLSDLMQDVIEEQLVSFEEDLEKGPIDIYPHMLRMAFNIIARSIFGSSLAGDELQLLSDRINEIQEFLVRQIRMPFMNPWYRLTGKIQHHERLAAELDERILARIEQRRSSGGTHDDLLQMLLDARYEDTGAPMSDQQLLDEIKILFVAGHDTSANALAWTWHLLGKNPAYLRGIRKERERVIGDRRPHAVDLRALPLTRQVIDESMRLYPPAWVTDRMAQENDEYNGIPIAKGTYLVTYIYSVHHSAHYWEDPERFWPERFAPENAKGRPAFAHIPFGGGPRLCIGNNFAIMEMQLVLAEMARRYDCESLEAHPPFVPLLTLRPERGIPMRFWKR